MMRITIINSSNITIHNNSNNNNNNNNDNSNNNGKNKNAVVIYKRDFHGDAPCPVLQMETSKSPVLSLFCQAAAAANPPPKPAQKSWASEPVLAASLTLAVTSTLIALRKSL